MACSGQVPGSSPRAGFGAGVGLTVWGERLETAGAGLSRRSERGGRCVCFINVSAPFLHVFDIYLRSGADAIVLWKPFLAQFLLPVASGQDGLGWRLLDRLDLR